MDLVSDAQIADPQDDPMDGPPLPDSNVQDHDSSEGEDLDQAAADLELEDNEIEFDDDDDSDDEVPGDDAREEEEEEEEEEGVRISPSAIPSIGQPSDRTSTAPSVTMTSEAETSNTTLHPEKPTPYIHDAGHLLVSDPNPLPQVSPSEPVLASVARDATQSLLNHLLTTCPVTSSKTGSGSGVNMTLPPPVYQLPREKPVPQLKPPTKWEQFAAKKGIGKNNKRRGEEGPGRAGKMVYDEQSGEWVPRYGYKGRNKQGEGEWLVEVDEKKEAKAAEAAEKGLSTDPRTMERRERKERVRKNERKMRGNQRNAGKVR